MIQFILNQKEISTGLPGGTILLDFIRYHQHLAGTKIGCREGDCGACTVLVGELKEGALIYRTVTSCLMPLGNVQGKHIVTIEGLNIEGLNFIQQTFSGEGATQCGFCTPGFIVSLAGFCLNNGTVCTQSGIDAVNGNICRCTGYKSIERAIAKIAGELNARSNQDAIGFAVEHQMIPPYFSGIKNRLAAYNFPANGSFTSGGNAPKFLAGGTDLYVQQHDELEVADIDFLFDKKNLNGIEKRGNKCILGGSVTATDVLESDIFRQYFPSLNEYIKLVSSTPIRNMATIAGNFINGSPIGDFTIFFLALNAQLILNDGTRTRELPLKKLFKGYKTLNKTPAEYIDKIYFELPGEATRFNFEKVSKRTHLDIASVNSAICITMDGDEISKAGISAGGVGPVPIFLEGCSRFLEGQNFSAGLLSGLVEMAQTEISPISDTRGSEIYKRLLLAQLIKGHFIKLFPGEKIKQLMNA